VSIAPPPHFPDCSTVRYYCLAVGYIINCSTVVPFVLVRAVPSQFSLALKDRTLGASLCFEGVLRVEVRRKIGTVPVQA